VDDEARTATGVIQRFTAAPRGEVDGAELSDGTLVHWPPHMGEAIAAIVARGDRVEVVGRSEISPDDVAQLEAASIRNLGSNRTVTVIEPGPRGRGPLGPRESRPVAVSERTVEGRVRRFTTAPMGEVDGAELSDGTVLHWPPHLQTQFADLIDEGDRVRATGAMETGPEGDTHFEVRRLTNLGTGAASSGEAGRRPRRDDRELRGSSERRLQALKDQVEQLRREIDRLQGER